MQAVKLSFARFQTGVVSSCGVLPNLLPGTIFTYIATRGMAGHSKWANIRHIKAAKDLERQKLFVKYSRMIRLAVKEGGGTDPKLNLQLSRVLELARTNNMPMSSIENVLKSSQKSQENAKQYILEYKGPGGVFMLAEVLTDSLVRARQSIAAVSKKLNMQEVKGSARYMFDEKGIIISSCQGLSLEEAMDTAIEAGAEDVTQEEDTFVFTCAKDDFFEVKKELEKLNIEVKSADIHFLANNPVSVSDPDMEKIGTIIEKLENMDDVMKVYVNV